MTNLIIGAVIGVVIVLGIVYRDKVKASFIKVKNFFGKIVDKFKKK